MFEGEENDHTNAFKSTMWSLEHWIGFARVARPEQTGEAAWHVPMGPVKQQQQLRQQQNAAKMNVTIQDFIYGLFEPGETARSNGNLQQRCRSIP